MSKKNLRGIILKKSVGLYGDLISYLDLLLYKTHHKIIPSLILIKISWLVESIGKYVLNSSSSFSDVLIQSTNATRSPSEYECLVPSAELSDVPPEISSCSLLRIKFINSEPADFLLYVL